MKKLEIVERINGKDVKKIVGVDYVFDIRTLKSLQVIDVEEKEDETLSEEYFLSHGATLSIGSDSYPYTIIKMNAQGTRATLQEDNYKVLDDYLVQEKIEYKRNSNGRLVQVYKNKHGIWKVSKCNSYCVNMKSRRFYQDPSF